MIDILGGPISLAVFAGSEKELNGLLMYIIYLRKCNVRIKERVSFHLAILKDKGPKKILINDEKISKMGCHDPIGVLKSVLKEVNKGVSDVRIYIKSSLNFLLQVIKFSATLYTLCYAVLFYFSLCIFSQVYALDSKNEAVNL